MTISGFKVGTMVLVVLVLLAVFLLFGATAVLALNVLFHLGIPYSLWTFGAAGWLLLVLSGAGNPRGKRP